MWLARRAAEFAAAGAEIVAVSTDSQGAGAALTSALDLPFAVLSDPDGQSAIKAFGAWREDEQRARPALIVLAPDGREVFRHVGADQADRGRERDALATVRALGLPSRPAPGGRYPHGASAATAKAFPAEQLHGFFYGVRSGANVVSLRTGDEQAALLREMAAGYLEELEP